MASNHVRLLTRSGIHHAGFNVNSIFSGVTSCTMPQVNNLTVLLRKLIAKETRSFTRKQTMPASTSVVCDARFKRHISIHSEVFEYSPLLRKPIPTRSHRQSGAGCG